MLEATIRIIGWFAVLFAVIFGVHQCNNSDWMKENDRKADAEARARQTPHVIREADGCKVYAFERDSKEHYFTRCGATVTTERSYTESCGKNCTAQKSEIVVTNGNK